MNHVSLVSIAIASYNNAHYIEELLDSIRGQTYPAIELIVIDDCSTDNSVAVIEQWMQRTGHPMRFVKHVRNQGIVPTFSECRQLSTGQYLSLIGSDDVLASDLIERTVAVFDQQDETCGAVYADCRVIDSAGKEISPSFLEFFNPHFAARPPEGNLIVPLLNGFYLPTLTTTVRQTALNAIGPYDQELFSEDLDVWLRLSRTFRFVYLPANLGAYRVHNASAIHANKIALNETYFRIYQKGYFQGEEEWSAARRSLADHAEHYYASQGPEAAAKLWIAARETRNYKLFAFWAMARFGVKYTALRQLFGR